MTNSFRKNLINTSVLGLSKDVFCEQKVLFFASAQITKTPYCWYRQFTHKTLVLIYLLSKLTFNC